MNYPGAEIVLLGIFPQARLAVPQFVDRVERLDAQELVPLFVDGPLPKVVRDRLAGFDLVISFLFDPDSLIQRNLSAAGAKWVLVPPSRMQPEVHTVFHLGEVLLPLGLTLRDPVVRFSLGPKLCRPPRLGFHIGSGSSQKNWPIDRWIELIQRLESSFSDFLLLGGEADEKVVREFCARWGNRRLTTLLNANLADLTQALNECTVFVGHDTGVTHLAAAVGTPTVALFGPTNAVVWAPLGAHVTVIQSPDGLMRSLPVAEAAEACRRMGEMRVPPL